MQCQYVGDGGKQCESEATRDIRVRASKWGWRFFLCDAHVDEVANMLRTYIDEFARDQIVQDTNSSVEKG